MKALILILAALLLSTSAFAGKGNFLSYSKKASKKTSVKKTAGRKVYKVPTEGGLKQSVTKMESMMNRNPKLMGTIEDSKIRGIIKTTDGDYTISTEVERFFSKRGRDKVAMLHSYIVIKTPVAAETKASTLKILDKELLKENVGHSYRVGRNGNQEIVIFNFSGFIDEADIAATVRALESFKNLTKETKGINTNVRRSTLK